MESIIETDIAGLLNTTKIVMSAPLPRVFELGEGGKAIAILAPPGSTGVIGGDFKGDDLTKASKDIVSRLSFLPCPLQHTKIKELVPVFECES